MNDKSAQRLHHVTALVFISAIAFCFFFQLNKAGPLRDINPFAEDPYDAVGSFAVQAALLIGLLSYARALRLRRDRAQAAKARLVLRGNVLVLAAIFITLTADVIAERTHPVPPTPWANVLLAELFIMFLLAILAGAALYTVFPRVPAEPPPGDLTPADAIDDLWTLVRVPASGARAILPAAIVRRVDLFSSDSLFSRVPGIDPRPHPWRFACLLGFTAGIALVAVQLQEGLPPTLGVGLLLAGIFISGELVATVLGFAILGRFLGLRPGLQHRT